MSLTLHTCTHGLGEVKCTKMFELEYICHAYLLRPQIDVLMNLFIHLL